MGWWVASVREFEGKERKPNAAGKEVQGLDDETVSGF